MAAFRGMTDSEYFINRIKSSLFDENMYKIQPIKDYINQIDEFLETKGKDTEEKILEWQNSDVESKYPATDHYEEDMMNYYVNFKQIKLKSTFLISFSMFEYFLKDFTESYKYYYELELGIEDLSGGNYIERSKTYLRKVIGLDTSSLNQIWEKIKTYQWIRNKIVHNNGELTENDKNRIKEINKLGGVKIEKNKIILNDKIFIFSFWDLFDQYIEGIIILTINKVTYDPTDTTR